MTHATMVKFGHPETLVRDYEHWAVLVRPAQVTAGSLVLVAKSEATAFGALPDGAHAELQQITAEIETMLTAAVQYERLNYLMLMMVDPHVHFHVIPRYDGSRELAGLAFDDGSWPGPPDLGQAVRLSSAEIVQIRNKLAAQRD